MQSSYNQLLTQTAIYDATDHLQVKPCIRLLKPLNI